ncbi:MULTISPECIES: flavin-dependent oxidoreductase [Streptomyces]|uniref:Flavin-dependent oxidoreductase n=1 Tax=Streptomyces lasiicapitis TaxID=1923961 RepID=A0ABQ2MPP9_9ACTN|nr:MULTISPECIES: flavin-dependent oxidoreductase [Streptomyces]QIB45792.1 flavin-dependent oxidoreductase [Streptomyces aureoverticillatus]GGO55527.1 flavin-dependent oxidoreductase [Streptomyces lasiicapitis]
MSGMHAMRAVNTDVLIAGAGIGGLTAALSLHAMGIGVRIVEPVQVLRPVGVGINLLPHAVRELTELGLGEQLAATAVPAAEMVHYDRHGNRIWGEPRGLALGYHWPQYSIHRGALQMMLLDAVRERLGERAVVTGTSFVRCAEPEGQGQVLPVILRDLARGREHTVRVLALIGADGLYSTVRSRLHPGEGPPLWNGIRMWRGIAEWHPVLGGRTVAIAGSNAHAKLVFYPISREAEQRGRALLNWVAEVRFPVEHGGMSGQADWNRSGRLSDVLPYFAGWRIGDLDVPALFSATRRILEYPMVDREPLPWWGRGPVTLLGDAAHPMYPVGSNGGSQAVLDARVLARCLAVHDPDRVAGLRAYEELRREATSALVLANRGMPADRLLQVVAERAPEGFDRVDDVLTGEELAELDAAYRWTTGTDVAELNGRGSWGA